MLWKRAEYSGWGRALRARGEIARPERMSQLEGIAANGAAPAIGNRRSYGDVALNDGGRVVDTTRLDRVIAFDTETGRIEVEPGLLLGDLLRIAAARGWLPPVLPGTGLATVGGAVANDVHGKNHHVAGSFGQHVTAITLTLGGKTRRITPRRDKTLFAATVGGLGQTGVITSVEIQLVPAAGGAMQVTETRVSDWDHHIALLENSEATFTVGWIDATARGIALGRGILEEAEIAPDHVDPPKGARAVPLDAPGFAMSRPAVQVFNTGYLARVPEGGRTRTRSFEDFFFPLDRVLDWNRLYGKRGFHQFQCVVPPDRTEALRLILERIAESGRAAPPTALKRMGPGRAGMLSFPMEGFTLAVDFPNRTATVQLIEELQQMTADAGGRIYFAKDALAQPELVRAMYPELPPWARTVNKADPKRALATDMVRRLQLRDPG